MMRAIFMLTVLLTGCQKPVDQPQQKAYEPSSVRLLWMDDISMPHSGTEFENAFVLEPECRGLIFRHWTGLSDDERMKAMKAPHWSVFYNGSDGAIGGVFSIHVTPTGFDASRLDTGVDSAEEAAKKCFVAKQKVEF